MAHNPMKKTDPTKLTGRRLAIVEKAFQKFDTDGSGVIDLKDLERVYDVSRHPRVLDGTMSESMVKRLFLNNFEPTAATRDGKVTWEEFTHYYSKMSAEVDRGREVDHDAYFELVVTRAWRLDEDPEKSLGRTRIQPVTLGAPEGLAASRNMDVIFPDPKDDNALLAFKAVVKPLFARVDLPQHLQGYFALWTETERARAKYLPLPGALLKPFDVCWQTEEGAWTGFQGVVSSNVDTTLMPDDLRAALLTPEESAARQVSFIPLNKPFNPIYKRTSDSYGKDADKQAKEVLQLKKAVFEGSNCGHVFAGRTGKFTRDFSGGAYRTSGLNTSTTRGKVHDYDN